MITLYWFILVWGSKGQKTSSKVITPQLPGHYPKYFVGVTLKLPPKVIKLWKPAIKTIKSRFLMLKSPFSREFPMGFFCGFPWWASPCPGGATSLHRTAGVDPGSSAQLWQWLHELPGLPAVACRQGRHFGTGFFLLYIVIIIITFLSSYS